MTIIEVRPSTKRFKGCWVSFECDGVEPVFEKKQRAINYACQRFGGRKGEVQVYADDNQTIERVIPVDGGDIYSPVGSSPLSSSGLALIVRTVGRDQFL